jgi:hypothetical protein
MDKERIETLESQVRELTNAISRFMGTQEKHQE